MGGSDDYARTGVGTMNDDTSRLTRPIGAPPTWTFRPWGAWVGILVVAATAASACGHSTRDTATMAPNPGPDGGDGGRVCSSECGAATGNCGAAGQACCAGGTTGAQGSCAGSLRCAGASCSCQIACSAETVERSDGSLWASGSTPVTTANGSLFLAKTFSAAATSLACAVDATGGVWCWGSSGAGQLGNGSAGPGSSSIPVQVVTSVGGPPVGNIAKVFVDGANGFLACAVDDNGGAWCWGTGPLGNGSTSSTFAAPVLTASGGAQLGGVDAM